MKTDRQIQLFPKHNALKVGRAPNSDQMFTIILRFLAHIKTTGTLYFFKQAQ
jgi:hypothetical protein